jgi:hypothetical protein
LQRSRCRHRELTPEVGICKKWTRSGVMKEGPDLGPKSSGYEPSGAPMRLGVGPAPHTVLLHFAENAW